MFGLGMSEMVLISIVALIVIGPKDLPNMFRALGQFTGKARAMAREFSRAMEAAASESGVNDITKTIKAAANPQKFGVDKLKEASGMTKGAATQALSEERETARKKMNEGMAKAAEARHAREAAAADAAAATPTPPASADAPKDEA